MKTVIANATVRSLGPFKKGKKYNVIKEFFYNGETHYKLTDGKKTFTSPTCFFDDAKE